MLHLSCQGQVIRISVDERIADKYINTNTVHFEFCERWDGMDITAQFTQNKTTYSKKLNRMTNTVVLPNEIVAGDVDISVFGVHPENGARITTIPVRKKIELSGYVDDGTTPTPDGDDLILQSKRVDPTEQEQPVAPDAGFDGLSQVTVGAISKTYVGSEVPRKSAQTYTPGTSNQTIASGQYLSGTQTIAGDADLIPGNIRSGVQIFGVTGSYTASGGSTTPKLQSKRIDPTEEELPVTPDAGFDGLSQVTVGAISKTYVGSNVPRIGTREYIPSANDQYIEYGQYLSGTQVIRGNANLIPGNIRSGVQIFGVTGNYTGSGGGTGSSPYSQAEIITWTPSSDTLSMSLNHSLGVVPDGYRLLTRSFGAVMSAGKNGVIALEADASFNASGTFIAVGNALKSGSVSMVFKMASIFDDFATEQNVMVTLDSGAEFIAGAAYEILVYKR